MAMAMRTDVTLTDPEASISINNRELTIKLKFATIEQATFLLQELLAMRARGEGITLRLKNPVFP